MGNFQGIIFLWIFGEIFKSALVHLQVTYQIITDADSENVLRANIVQLKFLKMETISRQWCGILRPTDGSIENLRIADHTSF